MKLAKVVVDKALEHRRDMQFDILELWGDGRITGTECIERILELEKIVPVDFKAARKARGKLGK